MTPRMRAPELPDYAFLQRLGAGGQAEVYLYEQAITGLKVAVKVLNVEHIGEAAFQQFKAESKVMAQLAGHPNIVPVMHAGVTADGRPYIVMKYYPKPNLWVRARRERLSVPEVLRIGVQIASAVETAHRAGILHRDIKPMNILTGPYGEPGLSDFGIAAAIADGGSLVQALLSVPWSPPEILFETAPGDQRADVYSLGATLWHLLGGRPPYEEPGGDNSHPAVMRRVERGPVPPVPRDDVPEQLQRLLRQMLAPSPLLRPQTSLAVAHGLQAIEQEQRLPPTPIVVPEAAAPYTYLADDDEGGATRPRGAEDAGEPATTERATTPRSGAAPDASILTVPPTPYIPAARKPEPAPQPAVPAVAVAVPPVVAPTAPSTAPVVPPPADIALPAAPARATGRTRRAVMAIGGALVIAVVASAVAFGASGADRPPAPEPAAGESDDDAIAGPGAPGIARVAGKRAKGSIQFTWSYDDPLPGDTFRWQLKRGATVLDDGVARDARLVLRRPPRGELCLYVRAARAGTGLSPATPGVDCV